MLTRKQHNLLVFINQCLQKTGVSPSFDEMRFALNLKSKSGIHRLVNGLEERGFIRRLPRRARAIEVLRPIEVNDLEYRQEPYTEIGGAKFTPHQLSPVITATQGNGQPLPLYGRIAAGTPIEAIQDQSNYVNVPNHLLGKGEYYALEVDGQSMIEAGIMDGDTIIIERTKTAQNGHIVVALVDNKEATLKTFRRQSNTVLLESASRDYETQIYNARRVKIQGRLVGLMRSY